MYLSSNKQSACSLSARVPIQCRGAASSSCRRCNLTNLRRPSGSSVTLVCRIRRTSSCMFSRPRKASGRMERSDDPVGNKDCVSAAIFSYWHLLRASRPATQAFGRPVGWAERPGRTGRKRPRRQSCRRYNQTPKESVIRPPPPSREKHLLLRSSVFPATTANGGGRQPLCYPRDFAFLPLQPRPLLFGSSQWHGGILI